MSEWSEAAARRSRERQEAKLNSEKRAIQERETLDAKGRELWSSVKEILTRKCQEFNAEPGNSGVLNLRASQSEVAIHCTGQPQLISGVFGLDTITFSGKNGIRFESAAFVRLNKDGLDVWLADGGDNPVDLEDFTNNIIETLLEGSGR